MTTLKRLVARREELVKEHATAVVNAHRLAAAVAVLDEQIAEERKPVARAARRREKP